jgi:dihydroxyacetone kinase
LGQSRTPAVLTAVVNVSGGRGGALVEPDYRSFLLEISAVAKGDRWSRATVRRMLSEDKLHSERA